MTDKQRDQLLRSAMADLRKTEEGYRDNPNGPNWENAFRKLEKLQKDLGKTPVPNLGPVLQGGPSMLDYFPTHNTDGVPLHPAFDAGFNEKGRAILAPEHVTVQRQSGAQGGEAVFLRGVSGIDYWLGHIGTAPPNGKTFAKGAVIARIADQAGTDHVHWGLDVRPLTGQTLKYGRNGNGPDYTFGSPSIGAQLKRMLG